MPVSTKVIKTRIKSVSNTKKITKAMEMVAASKMRRAVEKSLASREYAQLAMELLVNVSKDRLTKDPLLEVRDEKKTLLVIVTSNKGLCGGYHVNINKQLQSYVDKFGKDREIGAVCIGKYAERFARKLKIDVVASFIDMPNNTSIEDIRPIRKLLMKDFTYKKWDRVGIMYTNYVSAISSEVLVRGLLPVTKKNILKMITSAGPTENKEKIDIPQDRSLSFYAFEPSQEDVLTKILPKLIEVQIYQAIVEARASEHSSRMVAMKNASENAGELIDELTLTFNKARQSSITQEIVEIATGAAALQK